MKLLSIPLYAVVLVLKLVAWLIAFSVAFPWWLSIRDRANFLDMCCSLWIHQHTYKKKKLYTYLTPTTCCEFYECDHRGCSVLKPLNDD